MQPTDKTTISRLAKRGSYDEAVIHAILDEALLCNVAYQHEGQPFQIPTGFVRIGSSVYIHGSVGSHFMRRIGDGRPVCLCATLLDGIVLARSVFDSSMNYRSVILFASGKVIEDLGEKTRIFEAFTEKMVPGRWTDVRTPSENEIKKTILIEFPVTEASAKIREGMPFDDEAERDPSVWWGVIPSRISYGTPIPHPGIKAGVTLPAYLEKLK
jgi:nitroimidazol reductase NimA-like FMN-containing flavoprotein (pyridoxamine 5'-phosphate oxidase superfamily)